MFKLTITIESGNAAFGSFGDATQEGARILRDVAKWVERSATEADDVKLRDVNGNTVGKATMSWDSDDEQGGDQ